MSGPRNPRSEQMDARDIEEALDSIFDKISDQNYSQSLACYRFWFDIGQAYSLVPSGPSSYHNHSKTPSDQIFDAIRHNRTATSIDPRCGILIHPTAHLILRLASDVESDHILGPHSTRLQSRLCAEILLRFFSDNLTVIRYEGQAYCSRYLENFCTNANLIAHCANRGHVDEDTIRNLILQSLISHPKLYDHQADALIILFKLAGATLETYADPSVVDRCFKLLKDHDYHASVKSELVQVRVPCAVKGDHPVI